MPKKTIAEKNERNTEILLSLLGETKEEFESQGEKDGVSLTENVLTLLEIEMAQIRDKNDH